MTPYGFVLSRFLRTERPARITVADAADVLTELHPIDLYVPDGITPEEYAEMWNDLVDEYTSRNDPELFWIWHALLVDREYNITPDQIKNAIRNEYLRQDDPGSARADCRDMLNRLYAADLITRDQFLDLKKFNFERGG